VAAAERPTVALASGGGVVDPEHEATVLGEEQNPVGNASEAEAKPREKPKGGALRTVIEVVAIVAAAFVIAMLVQAFLVKPFTIHQVSMEPTLDEGDRILINRMSYHFRDPKNGDVIVFHSPITEGEDLVKRVIAVGGDRVVITDGKLYVNGILQIEPYLLEQEWGMENVDLKIPEGQLFVMGDNRNNSGDSRFFGPISEDLVLGCAFCVYWPISHWRGL
jgi:signal peptidase I